MSAGGVSHSAFNVAENVPVRRISASVRANNGTRAHRASSPPVGGTAKQAGGQAQETVRSIAAARAAVPQQPHTARADSLTNLQPHTRLMKTLPWHSTSSRQLDRRKLICRFQQAAETLLCGRSASQPTAVAPASWLGPRPCRELGQHACIITPEHESVCEGRPSLSTRANPNPGKT